jgi:hypothetical protein
MKYCGECGKENTRKTKFCSDCGIKFDVADIVSQNKGESDIKPSKEIDDIIKPVQQIRVSDLSPSKPDELIVDEPQRTIWLNIVIIINYILIGIMIIIGLVILVESIYLTLIAFAFAIYLFWINEGLKRYDTTRRGINIGLLSVLAMFGLFSFQLILIIPAGLQIYVLVLHKPTIELFD